MTVAPFFDRVYAAAGGRLSVSRASLEEVLSATVVGVRVGPSPALAVGWIAELVVNLSARLYPRLTIEAPEPLGSQLKALAVAIHPGIEICPAGSETTSIAIGADGGADALYPRADGWVARLFHQPTSQEWGPANPYSAGAAACLASAELFRRVFLRTTPERDFSVSLLDFGSSAGESLSMGAGPLDAALVGVGAVGSGAVWALSRDPGISGRLWLVDPEAVELSNLQRYVLPALGDTGTAKVRLAARLLARPGLIVEEVQATIDGFVDAHEGRLPCPDVAVSVDNVEGRRSAQALLPRLVVNGWTGEGALGASWHYFSRDAACLACLYHPTGAAPSQTDLVAAALGLAPDRVANLWVRRQALGADEMDVAAKHLGVSPEVLSPWAGKPIGDLYTDVVCGAVALDLKGLGRVETVPLAHQSVLAGVLMAAELVKRSEPKLSALAQSEVLVAWDDVLRPPPSRWTRPMARVPGCICADSIYQRVYGDRWSPPAPLAVIPPR